jgi:ribosome-binding protein aMBF1 (putative translation factor)
MPSHYDEHFEDYNQDWEPVVITKRKDEKKDDKPTEIPLHRRLFLARSREGKTAHEMCQLLHMKYSQYKRIEEGKYEIPTELYHKLRKLLNMKI